MDIFNHLIVNGRPACGKSELIDFLKKLSPKERRERYHIGNIVELDDFIYLRDKFVEDDLWEKVGEKRFHSNKEGHYYVLNNHTKLLDWAVEKFNYIVEREYLKNSDFYKDNTLFIEFSRGSLKDGGYRRAYEFISKEIFQKAAILFLSVSRQESIRKNEARYQEKLKLSILAHKVPDTDMIRWSEKQDWEEFTNNKEYGYLPLKEISVPFVTVNNEPEIKEAADMAERYQPALRKLMDLYSNR